jgi:oligoendopeptidase F
MMTTNQEIVTQPIMPESTLPVVTLEPNDELSEVKQATDALIDALHRLSHAKIQAATDVTQETYQSIEQSVQALRNKADQRWQQISHQVDDIDTRLTHAAKAAWEILTAPPSDADLTQ